MWFKNKPKLPKLNLSNNYSTQFSVFVSQNSHEIAFLNSESWVVLSPIERQIKEKIERIGTPLKDWDIRINYGIKTGFNEAFIIDGAKRKELIEQDSKSEEIIRPILRGRDIKRYGYKFADLWLINTHNGIKEKGIPPVDINDYPAIKKHLDQYYSQLEKRADKGDTPYNLRNCAYMEDFYKQKIIYQELTQGSSFALDDKGEFMIANTAYILTGNFLKYLLNILNSKFVEFVFKNYYSTQLGVNGIRWLAQNIENLPIPKWQNTALHLKIKKAKPTDDINILVSELYNLTEKEVDYIDGAN